MLNFAYYNIRERSENSDDADLIIDVVHGGKNREIIGCVILYN